MHTTHTTTNQKAPSTPEVLALIDRAIKRIESKPRFEQPLTLNILGATLKNFAGQLRAGLALQERQLQLIPVLIDQTNRQ